MSLSIKTRQDGTQHNDTQANVTQHNNTQDSVTEHKDTDQDITKHSSKKLALNTNKGYAECITYHFAGVIMLSVMAHSIIPLQISDLTNNKC
jgi:hypothetical protein